MDNRVMSLLWIMFGGTLGWVTNLIFETESVWFFANILGGMCGAVVGTQLSSIGSILETQRHAPTKRLNVLQGIPWATTGACVMVLFVNMLW